jgi:Glycosyl hydrolase family 20, domain 2/Glycosyl hydrolase family 20, catalytic domain
MRQAEKLVACHQKGRARAVSCRRDPRVPWHAKALAVAVAGYALSPIDLGRGRSLIRLFSLVLIISIAIEASASESTRFVLPQPKEVDELSGRLRISSRLPILGAETAEDRLVANQLADELFPNSTHSAVSAAVVFNHIRSWHGRDLGDEGYILEVSPAHGVTLTAVSSRGLYYAAQTLTQLITRGADYIEIPAVKITDWPDTKDRMVLYDWRDQTVNVDYWKRAIRELSRLKFNQVMLFMGDDYMFKQYPFMSSPVKLTPEKLTELRGYARLNHIQLLPQWESLGHAEYVLRHEEFADLRMARDSYQYSPCNEKTYTVLNVFYGELISGFDDSSYFHVGGDEVRNLEADEHCSEYARKRGLAHIYSQHFQRVADILRNQHQRRMAIWSDMILLYPEAANGLPRDTLIFDWHYEKSKDFPSLKFLKNLGFHNLFASPAVLGSNDLYIQMPVSIANIAGFTRAALREDVKSVCTTTWSVHNGGNSENYYYGLAYSAQVNWSAEATELAAFHRRFAAHWFGLRAPEAIKHLDRALWFPWRVSGSSELTERSKDGFWNRRRLAADLFFLDFAEFISRNSASDLMQWTTEAQGLLSNLTAGRRSHAWLKRNSSRNGQTLKSLEMVQLNLRHVARKIITLTGLSHEYRSTEPQQLVQVLNRGIKSLRELQNDFPAMIEHFRLARDERASDPIDFENLLKVRDSLVRMRARLAKERDRLLLGGVARRAEELGL